MFPLFDQDLPHIEQKIISYLGPADIVRSRKVCKKWAKLMQDRGASIYYVCTEGVKHTAINPIALMEW